MSARRWRTNRIPLIICLVVGGVLALSMVTVTTRQGIDFELSVKEIPLYAKAFAFLHRHIEYDLLAKEITQGLQSDSERVLAIFEWTRAHVRPTPEDWPVTDDHVLNIIIRGHGLPDQMADVFTTLATYAGIPAFWKQGIAAVAFARVDGRWRMFDVGNGLIFTDGQGQLADVDELFGNPSLIQMTAGSLTIGQKPYHRYVLRLRPFNVPPTLRAKTQMPLPRLRFEIQRALRPASTTVVATRAVSEERP